MVCEDMTGVTNASDVNRTGDKQLFNDVYHVLYGYFLPTICICGFLGNVMNLLILAGRHAARCRRTEQSANTGLIALAVADLCFCVSAFPSTFIPMDQTFYDLGFMTYYTCFCAPVISIFIMTSTWLTVTMSTERYLAICHPLKSRKILSVQHTKVAIIIVYISSTVFNIPMFWRFAIVEISCDNRTIYNVIQRVVFNDTNFDHAYRASWAVVGNFIPLLLLLVFNIALTREIHRSYAMRKRMNSNVGHSASHHHASADAEASNRITMTLVSIVVLFFIFVAPSELVKHVAYLFGSDMSTNYTYLTIEIITNVMQTINFSANFILYCIISPTFRRTMKELFCFQYQKLMMDGMESTMGDTTLRDRFGSMRMASIHMNSHGYKAGTVSVRTGR